MDGKAVEGSIMIRISNIYYMLAYAFRSLNAGNITHMGGEEFDNLHELFAEIIIIGMRKQLKRGLPRHYTNISEELSNLRGKIDIQYSLRGLTMVRHRLVCGFDEFTEDTPSNQLIKCTITHLLRQSDVSSNRKHYLKFLQANLDNVADVGYVRIPQQRIGGAEYIMLVNICRFLLDGLLMNTGSGYKMREWLTDEAMSSLYEHFLLEYFRRHYSDFKVRSAQIDWDVKGEKDFLPKMQSDIMLSDRTSKKKLIIDAKYYSKIMLSQYNTEKIRSNHLYQIFSYVKNEDKEQTGLVDGILLYAKTDEGISLNQDYELSGNRIGIRTLDLNMSFESIKKQLDVIVEEWAS